jgi:hypothetical protein
VKTAIGEMPEPDEHWHEQQRRYREQYRSSMLALGKAMRMPAATLRITFKKAGSLRGN